MCIGARAWCSNPPHTHTTTNNNNNKDELFRHEDMLRGSRMVLPPPTMCDKLCVSGLIPRAHVRDERYGTREAARICNKLCASGLIPRAHVRDERYGTREAARISNKLCVSGLIPRAHACGEICCPYMP